MALWQIDGWYTKRKSNTISDWLIYGESLMVLSAAIKAYGTMYTAVWKKCWSLFDFVKAESD